MKWECESFQYHQSTKLHKISFRRQREKLLHLFEMVPGTAKSPVADPARAVKMYNRSAAGKSMTNENCLRPPEVLLKTVKHLLEK